MINSDKCPPVMSLILNQLLSGVYLLLLIVLFSLLPQQNLACPTDVCFCKWKGGKQTVECAGQQLSNIPEGMDPGTQVLNFSGNELQVLQSERFLRMDLLNLQKIFLSRNQLIRIHEKAFRGLSNLVELDLSDNSLQHVPSETFQDYSSLMRLSLSGNPIRELKISAFRHLSFLTTLELSNCQIERIENEAFVGMDNLEWLRLDGNRIRFVQGTHILPKSLHGISLQSNRWTCDCRLLDVHAWLINYNTPQLEEPKCIEPARLKGQIIKSLRKDELACLPEVSPQSTYSEVSEGRNMSITCIVRAIPEPKVLWLFNGQVMSNHSLIDNLHMYYYIDESTGSGGEEKRSEIFIYNVGAEDNGTFSCVGQNIAGKTFSNYTLRVIIKEPPMVNEVSFPRDYMDYIIASITGGGIIFMVLLCTIIIKCKQREPAKRKYASAGVVTSITGTTDSTTGSNNDTSMMKCASIITDDDSLHGGTGDNVTPAKICRENGILGGQIKQNMLLYAPATAAAAAAAAAAASTAITSSHQPLSESLQLNVNSSTDNGANSIPPQAPQQLHGNNGLTYGSPPLSTRNYQEKNPDLVNDAAESVKHKLKTVASLDATNYDATSSCSAPCSIQSSLSASAKPITYNSCYQLTDGSQLGLRPTMNAKNMSRFTGMSKLSHGIQLKGMQLSTPHHQVDVHLNSVCFLGQDGLAYDYNSTHLIQPAAHQQLHLQKSLPTNVPQAVSRQQQQQNFYRTLPFNRAHKQQQFVVSAQNSGARYSFEAELVQRSNTPTRYDKYMPDFRFTAEGYPQTIALHPLQQFPSPPDGYKNNESINITQPVNFQQWPSRLPGYHAQAVHYPSAILGVIPSVPAVNTQHKQPQKNTSSSAATNQNLTVANTLNKHSIGGSSQSENCTIPECDETDISPTTSNAGVTTSVTPVAMVAAALDEAIENTSEGTSKLKLLNGPLADSPDEGYVGETQETGEI